ncbi:MAG: DUF948 domain-containing protein [Nitrospirae bacterium]|nr:DUF948 domain-containing protein [Nitrospirota bacterium]
MVEQLLLVITILLTVLLIVWVVFAIPTILQVKRTVKTIEDFLKTTERSLTPLLLELRGSAERINRVTEGIEESVKDVQCLTRSIGEIGKAIDEANSLVRQTGASFAIKTVSIGVGIKTALSILAKGLIKKASNKNA